MSIFRRIFISNRGEIALRIIRTCKELGIETVLGVSEPDRESLPTRFANRVVLIGPGKPADSYLNAELAVHTAKVTGCDAIHPGFGFLSENPHLAELCQLHDIVFIGPNANCLRLLGDKIQARDLAKSLGLPVLGGGRVENLKSAVALAKQLTYPIMLKASAGGGGRGIRIIASEADLKNEFDIASAEAEKSFADGRIHLETLIREARHIEVQILSDKKTTIHMGERDCSVQRRHQKLIEESPSPVLDEKTRQDLLNKTVEMVSKLNYEGAGTVEFIYDNGKFFFLEMNTRIQVEHPVSEIRGGIDIVKEQIKIASTGKTSLKQSDITFRGHVIECRINAEDPSKNFQPSPGTISVCHQPSGFRTRVDGAIFQGCKITPYYDSLICKLICQGRDRDEAIQRIQRSLEEFVIEGITTTIDLHKKILSHKKFINSDFDTNWLGKENFY